MGRTRTAERANSEKLCDSSVNGEKLGSPSKNVRKSWLPAAGSSLRHSNFNLVFFLFFFLL